jgi:ribonuclease T2
MSAVAHGMAALAPTTGVSLMPRTFFAPPVSSGCSNTGPASCSNTSIIADTVSRQPGASLISTHASIQCCFEANGQLLQVQFWDANPPTGPSDAWTIHGLWPDYCGSGYPQNCDPSRAYTNISSILQSLGQQPTRTLDGYAYSDQTKY